MRAEELIELIEKEKSQTFLAENINKDVSKLLFKHGHNNDLKALSAQIGIRKKLSKKIPEWLANPKVIFPTGVSPEQASSEATAKLKASLVKGKSLIDATGGMGIDSFYFSKSFDHVHYFELQADLAKITAYNFKVLGKSNIIVSNEDGVASLKEIESDYVYLDPARRGKDNSKLVNLKQCSPDVTEFLDPLVANGRKALIKLSPLLDISATINQLKFVNEIWVISHRNDCKELVFHLADEVASKVLVKTINITPESLESFSFSFGESNSVKIASSFEKYLYLPNSSILKSGGNDLLAETLNLKKLQTNTNLYSSDELIPDFPGKRFQIREIVKPYSSILKKKKFNVISRNYPDKASIIESKLKLKPSKQEYLIACKTSFANYTFILAQQK